MLDKKVEANLISYPNFNCLIPTLFSNELKPRPDRPVGPGKPATGDKAGPEGV